MENFHKDFSIESQLNQRVLSTNDDPFVPTILNNTLTSPLLLKSPFLQSLNENPDPNEGLNVVQPKLSPKEQNIIKLSELNFQNLPTHIPSNQQTIYQQQLPDVSQDKLEHFSLFERIKNSDQIRKFKVGLNQLVTNLSAMTQQEDNLTQYQ